MTGAIDIWIEVGQPDEKSIRQACGRAAQVAVYSYDGREADPWWEKQKTLLDRLPNLAVWNLSQDATRALAQLAQPTMQLQWTMQGGQVWIADGSHHVHLELERWKASAQSSAR